MSNAMDKLKLIAEVRKRPAIWDFKCKEHKSLRILQKTWIDVGVAMGSNVDDCKNTWQDLRSNYRVRVKKSELYIERDKLNGSYDPNYDYSSKWVYFEHMKFVEFLNSSTNDNNGDDDDSNQSNKVETELNLERNSSLDELDMSNSMYKLKLITEIRKRRELWDIRSKEHRSCLSLVEVWKDLAGSMESNVGTCQRIWMSLCKVYWKSVKRIELRKENKLKGSYNPNNRCSSRWALFEAMEFMKDNKTVSVILGSSTETYKLIAEIRKRPAIWDIQSKEHRHSVTLQKTWKELALAMGEDVENCKIKWKSLRLSYSEEAKKLELRIQEAKQNGSYNPNNDYSTYFEHMQFIDDIKKQRNMESRNTSVNDNNSDDNESNQVSKFHNMESIKMLPELDLKPEVYLPGDEDNSSSDLSGQSSPEVQEPAAEKPTTSNWKSTKGSYCRYSSDRLNLIAEVRKRPAIWDFHSKEHISKRILRQTWQELALIMGEDVNECRRKWKLLRSGYRDALKKLELRIEKDKSNGSYDSNNEYKCKWIFYEHMKFIHGIKKPTPMILDNKSLVEREMSNAMDKFKLIAEIRKRPALWDIQSEEHKSCLSVKEVWKDLTVSMSSEFPTITVETCKQIWNKLCRNYRARKNRIELRIKKEKLKGVYDPNNDYSSEWVFYEHMKFIKYIKLRKPSVNDNSNRLDERDMSNAMDKSKLIAEIRKRRELWDVKSEEHRSCFSFAKVWKDVAASMESDVDTCQRNWIILCTSYRISVKHMKSRIKEAKFNGSYDPNNDYNSKWVHFEAMQFMKDKQTGPTILRISSEILKLITKIRNRPSIWDIQSKEHGDTKTLPRKWKKLALAVGLDGVDECKRIWTNLLLTYRSEVKKLELRIHEAKLRGSYNPNNDYSSEWTYFEYMKFIDNIQKPSPIELRNSSVNDSNSDDTESNLFSKFYNVDNIKMEPELDLEPEVYLPDDNDDKSTTSNGKSIKRSYDQANFVEDIEDDDYKLIKSSHSDIKDFNDMVHVNDSDYNFLVSFLPQMEKINELQNLQFRTKITNLLLNIMSPSLINDTVSVSSSHNVNSNT